MSKLQLHATTWMGIHLCSWTCINNAYQKKPDTDWYKGSFMCVTFTNLEAWAILFISSYSGGTSVKESKKLLLRKPRYSYLRREGKVVLSDRRRAGVFWDAGKVLLLACACFYGGIPHLHWRTFQHLCYILEKMQIWDIQITCLNETSVCRMKSKHLLVSTRPCRNWLGSFANSSWSPLLLVNPSESHLPSASALDISGALYPLFPLKKTKQNYPLTFVWWASSNPKSQAKMSSLQRRDLV